MNGEIQQTEMLPYRSRGVTNEYENDVNPMQLKSYQNTKGGNIFWKKKTLGLIQISQALHSV